MYMDSHQHGSTHAHASKSMFPLYCACTFLMKVGCYLEIVSQKYCSFWKSEVESQSLIEGGSWKIAVLEVGSRKSEVGMALTGHRSLPLSSISYALLIIFIGAYFLEGGRASCCLPWREREGLPGVVEINYPSGFRLDGKVLSECIIHSRWSVRMVHTSLWPCTYQVCLMLPKLTTQRLQMRFFRWF